MIDDDYSKTFTFGYVSNGESKVSIRKYNEDALWSEVLNDFVDYLSYLYGYDIKEKVRVESPFWIKHGIDIEGWQGKFFDPDPKED